MDSPKRIRHPINLCKSEEMAFDNSSLFNTHPTHTLKDFEFKFIMEEKKCESRRRTFKGGHAEWQSALQIKEHGPQD